MLLKFERRYRTPPSCTTKFVQINNKMAATTKLAASIKVANPQWALILQRVANTRPPTQREKEAITGFLNLTPPQQNAVVTIHIRRMAQLNR